MNSFTPETVAFLSISGACFYKIDPSVAFTSGNPSVHDDHPAPPHLSAAGTQRPARPAPVGALRRVQQTRRRGPALRIPRRTYWQIQRETFFRRSAMDRG